MSKSTADIIEYIFLLTGLLVFFILILIFKANPFVLKILSYTGAVFYILWGFLHHALKGRLKAGTVLEYFFLGIMVILLFYLVLGY